VLPPTFTCELLSAGRRSRYIFIRALYASVLGLVVWMTGRTAGSPGTVMVTAGIANAARDFFTVFAFLQMLCVLALVPIMVAGAIAGERERRTLDDLLTTRLSAGEIVLGKAAARALNVALVLLAGWPVLAIAMLWGGIEPEALLLSAGSSVVTLVATAALAIAASVWRPTTRDAIVTTYVVLFALLAGPLMAMSITAVPAAFGQGYAWLRPVGDACAWVAAQNPLALTAAVAFSQFRQAMGLGWSTWLTTLGCYGAFTAFWFGLAMLRLRRAGAGPKRSWSISMPSWIERLRPRVSRWPMVWKEMFAERRKQGWLNRVAGLAIMLWIIGYPAYGLLNWPRKADVGGMASGFAVALALGQLLLLTARAATLITSERERDCWVSLMTTPLSARQILAGKLLGNLYAARWYVFIQAWLWTVAGLADPRSLRAVPGFAFAWAELIVYVSLLGICCSATAKNSTRAMAWALGLLLLFGGGYLLFVIALVEIRTDDPLSLLSPCIPYLLIYPLEMITGRPGRPTYPDPWMTGLMLYAVASFLLWALCTARLERSRQDE
jgi:ABC-type transport system involved in multi-copper enzyme maturation permease subunit